MGKYVKLSLAVSMLAVSFAANATATRKGQKYDDGAPTHLLVAQRGGLNSEVELGRWHSNLDAAKAYAEEHGVPLVAVWSNGDDCGHCKKWENCALSDVFEEWMPESGIVYYFGYNKDSGKGATLGEWCYWCGRDVPMGKTLPLVRLYWKKDGKIIIDRNADGDTVDGNYGRCTITSTTLRPDQPFYVPGDFDTYNPGGRYMIKYLKDAFPGYVPKKITKYAGGEFTAIDNENAGLQVIPGVTSVLNIPFWRTNETSVAQAATNMLWGVFPNGATFTNTFTWAVGERSKIYSINLANTQLISEADIGKKIRLVLYDGEKQKIAESGVYIISKDKYENSAGNPLWMGERAITNLISKVSAADVYHYVITNSAIKLNKIYKDKSSTSTVPSEWTNAVYKLVERDAKFKIKDNILNEIAEYVLSVDADACATNRWIQDKQPATDGRTLIDIVVTTESLYSSKKCAIPSAITNELPACIVTSVSTNAYDGGSVCLGDKYVLLSEECSNVTSKLDDCKTLKSVVYKLDGVETNQLDVAEIDWSASSLYQKTSTETVYAEEVKTISSRTYEVAANDAITGTNIIVETTIATNCYDLVITEEWNRLTETNRFVAIDLTDETFEYIRIDKPALKYGEWTMDLDVATNKVSNWNKSRTAEKKAYSLIYVGGSRWCPDCVMTDRHFLENEKFKAWAAEKNVALVALDIPADPTVPSGGPSLLTYVTGRAKDEFVTGRGTLPPDESMRWQSGAAYISRKGIDIADATKIAKRNRSLVSVNTLDGGWNRPERKNQARTGVPCFIALRDDGSVAGRWEYFSDYGPSAWNDGYLLRLEELLAQSDENEESNQNWRTTKQTVSSRGESSVKTLSHTDMCDTYKIDGSSVGKLVSFRILGCTNDVQGTVSVIQASDASEKILASASGNLSDQFEVSADIVSSNCYLSVSIDAVAAGKPNTPLSPAVAATTMNSTVLSYLIKSDYVLLPEVGKPKTETVSDVPQVTISTVEGESYKITNADGAKISEYFDRGAAEDIYIAKTTGAATIYLKEKDKDADTYTVSYQVWKTGQIGFEQSAMRVDEASEDFDCIIRVVRTGGSSGTAQVKLSLATNDVRCAWIRHLDVLGQTGTVFEWDYENPALTMEWGEGDVETKTFSVKIKSNENCDGDQKLVFKLDKGISDAGISIGELVVTIHDDEKVASSGVLAIDSTIPSCQKDNLLVSSPGSEIEITVGRYNGTDGAVSGRLTTSAGLFSNGSNVFECEWGSRESTPVTTVLTLPEKLPEGQTRVQVALSAVDGAAVDYDGKYLLIDMVASNAPKFSVASTNVFALRYVPVEKCVIAIGPAEDIDWSEVKVEKFSGSLAPGLAAHYDESLKSLVIDGVPTLAGVYEASYRVTAAGVLGEAVLIRVNVQDPAVPGVGVDTAMNPSIAVTRTYSDILVISNGCDALSGLMTLTVPRSGRLSAKVRMIDGTVISALSRSWNRFEEDGTVVAELFDVTGDETDVLFVFKAMKDGSTSLESFGEMYGYDFVMPAQVGDPRFKPENWAGYYTVNMPQIDPSAVALATGDAYTMLRMTDESSVLLSKMYYAGVLPDGTAFSGTASLSPDADTFDGQSDEYGRAILPILSAGSCNSLSGVFSIKPYAAKQHKADRRSVYPYPGLKFRWSHAEAVANLSYDVSMNAFGCYYDAEENLAECCQSTLNTVKLTFFALVDKMTRTADFDLGAPVNWSTNDVSIGVRYTQGAGNVLGAWSPAMAFESNGLKFNFNPDTGLVNGVLRLDFESGSVTAQWRGLVMPGWGAGCGTCQLGNSESLERPFISGSCWFTDVYRYLDAKGRQRTKSVKRGIPFSIGTDPEM